MLNLPRFWLPSALILKTSAQYGSAFRILFKAESSILNVLNTIIRKYCDVSNWLIQLLHCNKVINRSALLSSKRDNAAQMSMGSSMHI